MPGHTQGLSGFRTTPASFWGAYLFLSISKFREVNTGPFLSHLVENSVQVGIPRVNPKNKQVTHHPYEPHRLVESRWGILEPPEEAPLLDPKLFDMVLVPMLRFDELGYRLGYGGGYYDKFLSQVREDCLKVGLCFHQGLSETPLPREEFDVPLNLIVTEDTVFTR